MAKACLGPAPQLTCEPRQLNFGMIQEGDFHGGCETTSDDEIVFVLRQ
jgi:hypothetical protein